MAGDTFVYVTNTKNIPQKVAAGLRAHCIFQSINFISMFLEKGFKLSTNSTLAGEGGEGKGGRNQAIKN